MEVLFSHIAKLCIPLKGLSRDPLFQGYNARKLIQRCTYLLYCSVLSLIGNLNTRRMSKPGMGSIFQIKNQWNILVIGNYYMNYQNYQNLMLLTSSDTLRTLMHLLFTNSAQRELVSNCTQSIRNFPCVITLLYSILRSMSNSHCLIKNKWEIHLALYVNRFFLFWFLNCIFHSTYYLIDIF